MTVVPDNDDAGRDHARAVAANLAPVAARVRILELPALPPKGDVSDWLDGGGTIDELLRLAAEAPDFRLDHLEEEAESENIPDPLEGLIDSAATDPGTPFQPDVLERLAALKEQDRAAFETLRSQLKKVGCRVTALDEAVAGESGETGGRQSQADILIELTLSAELFHTPDGTASPISTRALPRNRTRTPTDVDANLPAWFARQTLLCVARLSRHNVVSKAAPPGIQPRVVV